MRRKKIEKQIFNFLMWLPFIIFGIYSINLIITNFATGNVLNEETSVIDFLYNSLLHSISFTDMESAILNSILFEPITYFLSILGMPSMICVILGIYLGYMVAIELLHIMYDFIIFLPRVLRSMIERGLND